MKKKIVIADADERFCSELVAALQDSAELEVVGTATDGEQAILLVKHHRPDILVLDTLLPKYDGLTVLERLRKTYFCPKVMMVSSFISNYVAATAARMGVQQIIRKPCSMDIKKVGGGARANNEQIREYGQRDAVYIKRQTELYQPDIIICCGRGNGKNADILYRYVFQGVYQWEKKIGGYYYFVATLDTQRRIPVVSFRHPQIWGGHEKFQKYYYDMVQIAEELRNREQLLRMEK